MEPLVGASLGAVTVVAVVVIVWVAKRRPRGYSPPFTSLRHPDGPLVVGSAARRIASAPKQKGGNAEAEKPGK